MREILTFFKVYTEFIERGSSASGPRDDRACLVFLRGIRAGIRQWRGLSENAFVFIDKSRSTRHLNCVTVIVVLFVTSWRNAEFWSQISLVENSKEEINFRLKTSSCIKHWVIVVLWGDCSVVWCYWTSDMCLAPLHRFRASRRKSPGWKFLVSSPHSEV